MAGPSRRPSGWSGFAPGLIPRIQVDPERPQVVPAQAILALEQGKVGGLPRLRQPEYPPRMTRQLHRQSNTFSDLLYKGVMGKDSFTSWKGNIIVEQGTRGANGYQANKNLIIDESAKLETIPCLEIKTDDVKCSHGVTVGNIDEDHLFYLQSRGMGKEEARQLIIAGFLESIRTRISNENLRDLVSTFH